MAGRTSGACDIDARAKAILFQRYWSGGGWRDGSITEGEFDYARRAGLMFEPVSLSHDAIIARAEAIRGRVSADWVGRAFLASLSTRRLDWRSALGSLAAILQLPSHAFVAGPNAVGCRVCGEMREAVDVDISVFSFERLKWGGVRHAAPRYAMFDLAWFASVPAATPTAADARIFSEMIERICGLPAAARPGDVEKSLRGLLPSNGWERRTLIVFWAWRAFWCRRIVRVFGGNIRSRASVKRLRTRTTGNIRCCGGRGRTGSIGRRCDSGFLTWPDRGVAGRRHSRRCAVLSFAAGARPG